MATKALSVFRIQRRLNRSFTVSFLLFLLLGLFGAFMALPLDLYDEQCLQAIG